MFLALAPAPGLFGDQEATKQAEAGERNGEETKDDEETKDVEETKDAEDAEDAEDSEDRDDSEDGDDSEDVEKAKSDDDAEVSPGQRTLEDGAGDYERRTLEGWEVRVHRRLLVEDRVAVDAALPILSQQLREIVARVPPPAVGALRKVSLWFSPAYEGVAPRAEYHPDPGWLRQHGRPRALARGIEFTDTGNFPAESIRMPNFTLHELAHAFHHQVLGFEHVEILKAFENARRQKLYERVRRRHGHGKEETFEAAYALSDHKEYFAELTEACFSTNDYFPFTRDELQLHDPLGYQTVMRAWGAEGRE